MAVQDQPNERACRASDEAGRNLCIARRARQIGMAEQHLDDADIGAAFQEVGREAVPQRMDSHALVEPGRRCAPTGRPNTRPAHRSADQDGG